VPGKIFPRSGKSLDSMTAKRSPALETALSPVPLPYSNCWKFLIISFISFAWHFFLHEYL
jgi:hypothetical protein